MSLTRRTALTLGLALLAIPARAQVPRPDPATLRAALGRGGLLIGFRHGRTLRGGVDSADWPRERQRLLSPEGEAQARAVGAAFRRNGWIADPVQASPLYRCREYAEIAFGHVTPLDELTGLLTDQTARDPRAAYARAMVRQPVAAGRNRVVVTHTSNMREAVGLTLDEGGAAIIRPAAGGAELIAVLDAPDDWDRL